MKKLTLITGMIIMIAFLSGTVNAQSTERADNSTNVQTTQTDQKTPGNLANKNGDGICDNKPNCCNMENCINSVDENGDGICDNCKENCGQGNCCAKGMQNGKCSEMIKSNCCSKDIGQHHCKGQKSGHKAKSAEPEKK